MKQLVISENDKGLCGGALVYFVAFVHRIRRGKRTGYVYTCTIVHIGNICDLQSSVQYLPPPPKKVP